jgi:hypothetical protein
MRSAVFDVVVKTEQLKHTPPQASEMEFVSHAACNENGHENGTRYNLTSAVSSLAHSGLFVLPKGQCRGPSLSNRPIFLSFMPLSCSIF